MEAASAHCVRPGEIGPGDLVAYARGEAPEPVERHVADCSSCTSEASVLASLERDLRAKLWRRTCPTTLQVSEYAADLLGAADRQRVAVHLVECPRCLDESRGAEAFFRESELDELQVAQGRFASLRRIIARPFEPAAGLNGLRGTNSNESVTYESDGVSLTVSVQRAAAGRGFVVTGLVVDYAGDPAGAPVSLLAGERIVQVEAVDDLGSFTFENVAAGTYRLELVRADAVIAIAITAGS